jgi:hypothetical protein
MDLICETALMRDFSNRHLRFHQKVTRLINAAANDVLVQRDIRCPLEQTGKLRSPHSGGIGKLIDNNATM